MVMAAMMAKIGRYLTMFAEVVDLREDVWEDVVGVFENVENWE